MIDTYLEMQFLFLDLFFPNKMGSVIRDPRYSRYCTATAIAVDAALLLILIHSQSGQLFGNAKALLSK